MSFTNWWFSEVGGGDEGVEIFFKSSQVNNIEPRPKVAAKNRFTTPHLVNIARDCGEHVPPDDDENNYDFGTEYNDNFDIDT